MRLARTASLFALALLGACVAKGPRITAPVGLDDPNRPVAAPNPPVALPEEVEHRIAIELRNEATERCDNAALASPHFDFNSASVRPEDNAAIRALADCVINGPLQGATLTLVGHADAAGDERYDEMLARARAEQVFRFLTAYGVPQAQMRIRATVDAPPPANEPAFPGDDVLGRRGRRVDIVVRR